MAFRYAQIAASALILGLCAAFLSAPAQTADSIEAEDLWKAINGGQRMKCISQLFEKMLAAESHEDQLAVPFASFPKWMRLSPDEIWVKTKALLGDVASQEEQLGIVDFATQWFERRRSWTKSFLQTRGPIAGAFAKRSVYIGEEAHRPSPGGYYQEYPGSGKLQGTVGMTYAVTTEAEMNSVTEAELLSNPAHQDKILPMEKTLNKAVPRYFDSKGRSLILELRTYAKDHKAQLKLGQSLKADMLSLGISMLKDYPDLYDKPIIYIYGDKTSVRLYAGDGSPSSGLGFKIQEDITPLDTPLEVKGTKWWVMAVTPRRLEQNFFSLKGERIVSGLNQPHPVVLPNGTKTSAAPRSAIHFRENGTVSAFTAHDEVEVSPGFVAAPGALVSWPMQGDHLSISAVSGAPAPIPKGAWVVLYEPLTTPFKGVNQGLSRVRTIELRGAPMKVEGYGLTVTGGVEYFRDGSGKVLQARGLSSEVEIAPGLVAAKGSSLDFESTRKASRMTLGEPYFLNGETLPTGTVLELTWSGDVPRVVRAFPANSGTMLVPNSDGIGFKAFSISP